MTFVQDHPTARESEVLLETLDRVWEAVAMLSPSRRIVFANRAATQILRRGAGIALATDGRLVATLAASEAVERVLRDEAPPAPVAVAREGEPPLVLTLHPLPRALKGAFGAVALMFISDPARKPSDQSAALRSAFGLTSTEARVAQSLSEGASLKQIAWANNVTYETVRSHLRRVLEKVGVRRQVELVITVVQNHPQGDRTTRRQLSVWAREAR